MLKIGILGLLLLVAQVGIFWFFFGAGNSTATTTTAAEDARKKQEDAADEFAEVQVSVQPFRVTNAKATNAGGNVHIDFRLVALVPSPQKAKFEDKLKSHEARIRQLVANVARSLTLEDIHDPELGTLKRRVREEINKDLRASFVQDIVVVDYTHMEQ